LQALAGRSPARELAYTAWHAIAEANRIFGFDGWDRETVEQRCIATRETRGSVLRSIAPGYA
jgi:recombination DNA repair RAD52 pathway protein